VQLEPTQPAAPDLREYLAILRYRKWTIALTTALVVASAMFFSIRQTPIYESEARILVRPSAPAPGVAPVPVNLDTERALVDSAAVATEVQDTHDVAVPVDTLLENVEVSVETNTEILSIRYADPDAVQAQRLAQAFAESYLSFRREQIVKAFRSQTRPVEEERRAVEDDLREVEAELGETEDPEEQSALATRRDTLIARLGVLEQQLQTIRTAEAAQGSGGEIVQPSALPEAPARPDYLRNGLLALAVGLVLGVGLAFLRERLDERLASREELEALIGAPVLATIPRARGGRAARGRSAARGDAADVVSLSDPTSPAAEAYRTLRTNVQFLARTGELKTLAVVSPAAGEGKTMTTANLAASLARAGKRVIVVSTDLRKPRIHRCFAVPAEPGVTDVLSGMAMTEALQRPRADNVLMLASGRLPSNPAELMSSEKMDRLLEELRNAADFVILDTPPLLAVSDGLSLASRCDGVLVVADARSTARGALSHAREQLDQVGATILGGVLNNFDASRARYTSHYHGYYYSSYRPKEERGTRPRPADDPRDWDPAQMWS
jgi:non-specific protein-tyrosine kinase